jgi:general secretion pathway protein J
MRRQRHHSATGGFTLIEMMVALVIMAMIGLMAWRGLDALVRGKERLEDHAQQQRDLQYALTLLDRDCLSMVVSDDQVGQPIALGNRSVWWVRHDANSAIPAWQIVGYRHQSDGLYRLITPIFTTKDKAKEAWLSLSASPDGGHSQTDQQRLSHQILRQDVTVLSDAPNKTSPIKGLRIRWYLASHQVGSELPVTRICLAGGFR